MDQLILGLNGHVENSNDQQREALLLLYSTNGTTLHHFFIINLELRKQYYYCMCVWSSHVARVRINRVRLPILLVVS